MGLLMEKIKTFFNCTDVTCITDEVIREEEIKHRKSLFALILDFSFFPQVIWAAVLFFKVNAESAVLIYNNLSTAILISCGLISVFAILCVIRRFYFLRVMLAASYITLVSTAFYFGYRQAYARFIVFAVFGTAIALINAAALYGYRFCKKQEVFLSARPTINIE